MENNNNSTMNHHNMERHFNINAPSFKQQQQPIIRHPNPSPSTSSNNIPKNNNNNMFYSPNDQWAITHPPHLSHQEPTTSQLNHDMNHTLDNNSLDQTSPIKSEDSDFSPSTDPLEQALQQQHMQQLFEKKRRRRESHNAVERRRRDNINERIYELSTLLPEPDATKNNKGTILRKSVEHIRMLHEEVNKCHHQIQELENILAMYRMRVGDIHLDLSQPPPPPPPQLQQHQQSPRLQQQQQQQQSQTSMMQQPPSAHSMNFPDGLQSHMTYYPRRNG
ncbi:hypothetical protein BJ944DRAFT_265452 [Cunninghamella echinulata]|nr:hypothetical protein BJ944DRAFT_265452 [Cunninghamella echinulata]